MYIDLDKFCLINFAFSAYCAKKVLNLLIILQFQKQWIIFVILCDVHVVYKLCCFSLVDFELDVFTFVKYL